jgi:hypothetical protein
MVVCDRILFMLRVRLHHVLGASCLTVLLLGWGAYVWHGHDVPAQSLPERLSDAEFWKLINEFSEPGGYFRSDNFISNETTFQYVIPDLNRRAGPGGVYLGVGPDQNFTYIVALRPKLAFITDIRRQNMLLHLVYKALLETSTNRVEFLSKLFSRPLPDSLNEGGTTEELFEALDASSPEPTLAQENLRMVLDRLEQTHNFSLSDDDVRTIEYVYRSFVTAGPDIRYSFPNQYGWRRFPSYAELMLETDEQGEHHSYVASEENFQILRRLELENRIIPIVGDFSGDQALQSVGRYLKAHQATVTAFYTSNVEFYLFQSEDWKRFYHNVAALPVDRNSFFIRAYFNNYGFRFPNQPSGTRSVTLLDNMNALLAAYERGEIRSYFDVVRRSAR